MYYFLITDQINKFVQFVNKGILKPELRRSVINDDGAPRDKTGIEGYCFRVRNRIIRVQTAYFTLERVRRGVYILPKHAPDGTCLVKALSS
jgi:hypothetical protein